MKGVIIAMLVLAILGGGYVGYTYLKAQQPAGKPTKTNAVTITGKLQTGKGDDYGYVLFGGNGKMTGVASFGVDLGQYVGRVVTVQGQYSGTTMYADSVTEGATNPTKAK